MVTPAYQVARSALEVGINVLPIKPDGSKQPAVAGWKKYQAERPTRAEVARWFSDPGRGLALVTGRISRGLIALDFDDPPIFEQWLLRIRRDQVLLALYASIASGYEERTPKGGRHLLFFCPEAFAGERRPGSAKLALRPQSAPQLCETLAETKEEGGIIIVDPSRGGVHPTRKPYVRLRGSVSAITTITLTEREALYASIKALDEMPLAPTMHMPSYSHPPAPTLARLASSHAGERPGDLFNHDPLVTWESLLIPLGWDLVRCDESGKGYWRHPGKVGPNHDATTNAEGKDCLYCFSAAAGLPSGRFLDKFAFYAYTWHEGDFKAAASDLARRYRTEHVPEIARTR
jgi:Bifunctional DNA primase/polymerase, N-terminal